MTDTMNLTFNLPSNQLKEVSVKKSTMLLMLVLTLVVMAASLTGCGGSSTKTNPATEDTTTTTASGSDATAPDDETDDAEGGSSILRAEDLSDTIVLPAGFKIEDAVTPEDLEEVIGKAGWVTFPRPDSSPSKGRPEVDYLLGEDRDSKINFLVYAQDGEAKFNTMLGFLTNPEEVASDLWDKLIVGDRQSGGDLTALVLRNDVVMSITWNPEYYCEFPDRLDLGVALGRMMVGALFKAR